MSIPTSLRAIFAPCILAGLCALPASGCADEARLPPEAGFGPHPVLPEPKPERVPTIEVARATGWPRGATPTPAPGLKVSAYADGLDHPRWLYVLPNGDVLVAETNGPQRPENSKGVTGWIMKHEMKRAGAGTPSPNRIVLLRDSDGDGVAETRSVLLDRLNSPFGMALVGDWLYVADTDALLRFPYRPGETQISAAGEKVVDLPGGPLNHHWTKNVLASRDGSRLFVTVGSNSNAAENGIDKEGDRARIVEVDLAGRRVRSYATGLRNPNGLAWEPRTGALWTVVNERDALGSDLVPDYLTAVREGGFYGWPYSYYGQHLDPRVAPQQPELVAKAVVPDYALGSHSAALGLAFYEGSLLGPHYAGGAFVSLHGSWNRKPPAGYKVIFVPFADGHPAGAPEDVLSGFLDDKAGEARGRPVGVAVDRAGALLVADDVGNTVWRVTPAR